MAFPRALGVAKVGDYDTARAGSIDDPRAVGRRVKAAEGRSPS